MKLTLSWRWVWSADVIGCGVATCSLVHRCLPLVSNSQLRPCRVVRVSQIRSCSDIFNSQASLDTPAAQLEATMRSMSQSIGGMITQTTTLSAAEGASVVQAIDDSSFSTTFKQILTQCVTNRLSAAHSQQQVGNATQKMDPVGALA